jgi:aminobenzoyl-glutamate utilization protein B
MICYGLSLKKRCFAIAGWILIFCFFQEPDLFAQAGKQSRQKLQALQLIEDRKDELIMLSDSIWHLAEPSFEEIKSSKLLIEFLRKEGFTVKENVSGFPTVFIANYGTDKPVIGLYGEYDADPNASNAVVPRKQEIAPEKLGHGGGHNLLGVGSLGTALAIKELIERKKLKCTIRYYGTTAEGKLGSKTYLARDGYFNDLDLSLYWHPAPVTVASTAPWDALIDLEITVTGRKVNVMLDKESIPTTTENLELIINELHALRGMTHESVKLNYSINHSPHSLNESPDTTRITVRIQCARQGDANQLFEKVNLAVGKVKDQGKVHTGIRVIRAMHQFLPNVKAMEVVQKNLEWLGPIQYAEAEQQFVKQLQQHLNIPADGIHDNILPFTDNSAREQLYGYASDIGDASWIAPEIYFIVRSLPAVAMHQWPGTIFTGHSIGHKGMIQASKALALTIVDYVEDPMLQREIREDFVQRRQSYRYHSLIPEGPPPITKVSH